VKFWHMHGKYAIRTAENGPQRPSFVAIHGFIPPPQGIGTLLRDRDLLAYGRILYMVEL
jgi:hypothetical protein